MVYSHKGDSYRLVDGALYRRRARLGPKLMGFKARPLFATLRSSIVDTLRAESIAPLFGDSPREAYELFARAKGDFWGHHRWQSMQPYAGRAIATARYEPAEAMQHFKELGFAISGGSLEGHALAAYALLGRYDRLEDFPAWPGQGPDEEQAEALRQRNTLLRAEVRHSCEVRLLLHQGKPVKASLYKNKDVDNELAAEAALAAGDFVEAEHRFARMQNAQPSWFGKFTGAGDPRAAGALGRARIAHRRGIHTLALKHAQDCLALLPNHGQALLLAANTATTLQFVKRAKQFLQALRTHCPGERIAVEEYAYQVPSADFVLHTEEEASRAAVELYELASREEWSELKARAQELLQANPAFLSAGESLAYAQGKLGTDAEAAFMDTGLGECFGEPLRFEDWMQLPAMHALSPRPIWLPARINELIAHWAPKMALRVASRAGLANNDELRFLIAGCLIRVDDPASHRSRHEQAWALLEPYVKSSDASLATMDLAGDILRVLGKWCEIKRLKVPSEALDYPALTDRAYLRSLPLRIFALIAAGDHARAAREMEQFARHSKWQDQQAHPGVVFARRLVDRKSVEGMEPYSEPSHINLSDEAWRLERRGQVDRAIQSYLAASNAHPTTSSILLGNAGNLLSARGEYGQAWPYLELALMMSSAMPKPSRAQVLSQVGRWFRDQSRFADGLPLCWLAWDFEPSPERAAHLSECYNGVGDAPRAARALARGQAIEPRHPALTALEFSVRPSS